MTPHLVRAVDPGGQGWNAVPVPAPRAQVSLSLEDLQAVRDGLWLVYASNESGRYEVYVRSFPDGRRTLPISSEGGISPMWSPDGRELFYWNTGFTKLMKVDISPGQNLSAGTPKLLFEFAAAVSRMVGIYDIAPDGQRFLIREKKNYDLPPVTELRLVRNWFAELKRLSPTGK